MFQRLYINERFACKVPIFQYTEAATDMLEHASYAFYLIPRVGVFEKPALAGQF